MRRKVIEINESLCNGCGNCITGCAEGALKIVNGKAKLVREDFCDGFGNCIGTCPTGALKIVEREAMPFNEMVTVSQWPIQLHLVNPLSKFFDEKELVVMSTCAPLAKRDCHKKYLVNRSVVVACPKLDNTGPYLKKLIDIFTANSIPKIIVVRMEVPCCGGLTRLVKSAIEMSGKNLVCEEHIISTNGSLIRTNKF